MFYMFFLRHLLLLTDTEPGILYYVGQLRWVDFSVLTKQADRQY